MIIREFKYVRTAGKVLKIWSSLAVVYTWQVVCIAGVGGVSYTALYNLLNFPVGVIPITKVTAEDEDQLRHYKGIFRGFADKLFIKVNVASYWVSYVR